MRGVVRVWLVLLLGIAVLGLSAPSAWAPSAPAFSDVSSKHWATKAVKYVAGDRDWMRDFGANQFKPDAPATRRQVARALVRAFAPSDKAGPLAFSDVAKNDPYFAAVAVAVARGWLTAADGVFRPNAAATKLDLSSGLTKALGLNKELAGLDHISTVDGFALAHSKDFPALSLGSSLGLFRNHPDESKELLPASAVPRADAAWALWRAATAKGTWRVKSLERFRSIALPSMASERRIAIEFALSWVGYPYVYAGEWNQPTPKGYCCGAQPQGGFDCSGFVWWVLRARGQGFDNTAVRPYAGWPLAERSSSQMAKFTMVRLGSADLLPGDLMFSNTGGKGTDWQSIDHVGIAMGGGWMIHSSSPGVVIEWAADGWWPSHFRWGRRVIPDMSGSATGGAQAGDGSWQDGQPAHT